MLGCEQVVDRSLPLSSAATTVLRRLMSLQSVSSSLSNEDPARSDFDKLWDDALQRYRQETKTDLFDHSIAKNFSSLPGDPDQIIHFFEKQKDLFKAFRGSGAKARRVLKLIVDAVLPFLDAGAEAASVRVPIGCS